MDHKPESETLRQRRKAQQDLMELKKAKQAGVTVEHTPYQDEIRPQGFVQKIAHWWYYYRVPFIGLLLVAGFAAFFCVQCAKNPKKDIRIAAFDYHYISEMHISGIQDSLSSVCPDFDGNGSALVEVINCTFEVGVSTAEQQQVKMQKLQSLVAVDTKTSLFITSADTWDYLNDLSDTGLLYAYHPFTKAFYETIDVVSDFPAPQNIGIAVKNIGGTLMEKNGEALEATRRAEIFLQALKDKGWIE